MSYTTTERLAEIERELRMRYRNYPRWVAEGKMTQRDATKRIAVMEQIAAELRSQLEMEKLPL
jgi:hypothetical protein